VDGEKIWKEDMNCSEEEKKQGRTNRAGKNVENVNYGREAGRKSLKEDVNCGEKQEENILKEDVRTRSSELHLNS
jgi:hypothetical protein